MRPCVLIINRGLLQYQCFHRPRLQSDGTLAVWKVIGDCDSVTTVVEGYNDGFLAIGRYGGKGLAVIHVENGVAFLDVFRDVLTDIVVAMATHSLGLEITRYVAPLGIVLAVVLPVEPCRRLEVSHIIKEALEHL